MSSLQKLFYTFGTTLMTFSIVPTAYAAATMTIQLENPLGDTDTLPELIEQILRVVIQIGFPILVLAIVYSGFLFIAAQGNEKKLTDAKRAFTWVVIGGAILLGALAIAELLNTTIHDVGAGI
ncbi:MAG: hypothetical protein HGA67_03870 [Candidatus Yonathbacteria bacterium]|nr:hypothetical protein [Candidatus Yonathbacteria bacterium]